MLLLAREGDRSTQFTQKDNFSVFILQDQENLGLYFWVQENETWGRHSLRRAELQNFVK